MESLLFSLQFKITSACSLLHLRLGCGICIDRWFALVWCLHTWVVFENWHCWSAGITVVTLGKGRDRMCVKILWLGMAKVFHTPPKSVGRSGASLRFDRCPLKDHVSPEHSRKTPRSKTPGKQVRRLSEPFWWHFWGHTVNHIRNNHCDDCNFNQSTLSK